MRYSLLLPSAFVVAVGGFWLACVGDDPAASTGPATGDYKGACFSDKTCKTGLVCTQDVCLQPGETPLADGGTQLSDASGMDGGGHSEGGAENDAGPNPSEGGTSTCGPISTFTGLEVSCPDAPNASCKNDATAQCCRRASGEVICRPVSDCVTMGGLAFACDDTVSCNGGSCCMRATVVDAGTSCGRKIEPAEGSHCTANVCATNEVQLCGADKPDCPGTLKCVPVNVILEGSEKAIWKICL